MAEKMENEKIRNELFYQHKNGFDRIDTAERLKMEEYCGDYMRFLGSARTEREAVTLAVGEAESRGFVPYTRGMEVEEQMAPKMKLPSQM